jgi:hypothetical protein
LLTGNLKGLPETRVLADNTLLLFRSSIPDAPPIVFKKSLLLNELIASSPFIVYVC